MSWDTDDKVMAGGFALVGILLLVLVNAAFFKLYSEWKQIVVVRVSGEEVFQGRSLCVDVKSAGSATQVDIGMPCEFPERHYVDKFVKVYTLEKQDVPQL